MSLKTILEQANTPQNIKVHAQLPFIRVHQGSIIIFPGVQDLLYFPDEHIWLPDCVFLVIEVYFMTFVVPYQFPSCMSEKLVKHLVFGVYVHVNIHVCIHVGFTSISACSISTHTNEIFSVNKKLHLKHPRGRRHSLGISKQDR